MDNRPGDLDAPLEYATELAAWSGEGNAYWMGFGPTNVGFWRLHTALEAGDHPLAPLGWTQGARRLRLAPCALVR